ncbi:MAG: endonuclease/exonuclease/phosphatase family protein [Kibdelosporangium sp.]
MSLIVTLGVSVGLLTGVTTATAQPRPVLGPAQGDSLHVMSFNLRFASASAPNSWPQRRSVVAELLNRELPTVLGTQEGLSRQLRDIDDDLPPRYDWLGVGRDGGSRGEFTAIFYDTSRLLLRESGQYWLSDTPAVTGSATWGNEVPRMVTWARFADRRDGKEFYTVNTHFDNNSDNANRRAAILVLTRIGRFTAGLPVLLIGDFNDPAGNAPSYDIMVTRGGLTDSWPAAARHSTALYATYHGYRRLRPEGKRIDWILTKGAVTVNSAAINTFAKNGQYPSDHFPVHASVTLH